MINFSFVEFAQFVMALAMALFSSSVEVASAHATMLNAGDRIGGMELSKGAAEARPLWVFCSSTVDQNVTSADCHVPAGTKLAIGHVFLGRDDVLQVTDWSDLVWNLSIDGQLINLDNFGTYDYILPTMSPSPSLVREVFMKFTAWDVVLSNLQPGTHTIEGAVRSDKEQYKWIVNLLIEDTSAASAQFSPQEVSKDVRARCPRNVEGAAHFQPSCRVYG